MGFIKSIATAVPEYRYNGEALIDFLNSHFEDADTIRKLKFLWRESGINRKYSVLPDFGQSTSAQLFNQSHSEPDTASRMQIFKQKAPALGAAAAQDAINQAGLTNNQITDIITVSCTGLSAPGLEIMMSQVLGLESFANRHAVNFMGCYASFHALRLANMICNQNQQANVLVVSVELCSLHFNRNMRDDNLLSTTLFGDGCAAVVVSANSNQSQLEIKAFSSDLIPDGAEDMAWDVGNNGFEMVLNKNVPKHIESAMESALVNTVLRASIRLEDVDGYAIHPGGKNVLKSFARALKIDDLALNHSFEVLRNFGNMSSASILYVLKSIIENEKNASEIYAAAFGPGLTIESAIFSKT